jgi:hypothetical protein
VLLKIALSAYQGSFAFLWVWEGNGWEVRMRINLLSNRIEWFQIECREGAGGTLFSNTMHCCVDNLQIARRVVF